MVKFMEIQYIVSEDTLIKDFLQKNLYISNRLLAFLTRNHLIFLNGNLTDTRNIAKSGDTLSIDFGYEEDNSNIVPKEMNLDILYEDDWMLIVNKPSGIAIHPSILHYDNSLSNGVRYYFDKIGLKKKIRPVNRLDLYTSGIVVFAKCAYIHEQLSSQIQNGNFIKKYYALVHGKLEKQADKICFPISRKSGSIIERCVDLENGQKAVTEYMVMKYFEDKNASLVMCNLLTGRTHQIRVHFSYIGHPLVGDSLYGSDLSDFGQMLHCFSLDFTHPVTHKNLHLENMPKWVKC